MLYTELCNKEVINIKDCKKLGHVVDLEFDQRTGCICKITVGGCGMKFCSFLCPPAEYVICYKDIRQIGPDIILVDLCL